MGEMHREGIGEGARASLPSSPSTSVCPATLKLSEPILWGFYGGSIMSPRLIKSLVTMINSTSSPPLYSQRSGTWG